MKRTIASILCASMMVGMLACGSSDNNTTTKAPETTVADTKAPETNEETKAPETDAETKAPETDAPVVADDDAQTIVNKIKEELEKSSDLNVVAGNIATFVPTMDNFKDLYLEGGVMPFEDGDERWLQGFNEEIKNFKTVACIAPMIGTIPYVNYIFETDDTAALQDELKASVNPRWNICTEAKDPVIEVTGNYVIVVMIPSDFEE